MRVSFCRILLSGLKGDDQSLIYVPLMFVQRVGLQQLGSDRLSHLGKLTKSAIAKV
jgi:hypothetical protein